ncbi:hypothetical protein B0H11DRAFT_2301402 [Mycena galericulata]|nr:hypothetical protein B0H11DRAFT_2301402 [Mycena galericulata]
MDWIARFFFTLLSLSLLRLRARLPTRTAVSSILRTPDRTVPSTAAPATTRTSDCGRPWVGVCPNFHDAPRSKRMMLSGVVKNARAAVYINCIGLDGIAG